jgi:hypothetical protein
MFFNMAINDDIYIKSNSVLIDRLKVQYFWIKQTWHSQN